MKDFSISPQEMVASFWRNRALIKVLTQREVLGRYRGSKLGLFWSLFNDAGYLHICVWRHLQGPLE
jgi:lipopolysaccharide transport system permease protein